MDLQKDMYDSNGRVAEQTEKESKAFGITDRYTRTRTRTPQEVQPMFEVHRPGRQYVAVQVVIYENRPEEKFEIQPHAPLTKPCVLHKMAASGQKQGGPFYI